MRRFMIMQIEDIGNGEDAFYGEISPVRFGNLRQRNFRPSEIKTNLSRESIPKTELLPWLPRQTCEFGYMFRPFFLGS